MGSNNGSSTICFGCNVKIRNFKPHQCTGTRETVSVPEHIRKCTAVPNTGGQRERGKRRRGREGKG